MQMVVSWRRVGSWGTGGRGDEGTESKLDDALFPTYPEWIETVIYSDVLVRPLRILA